jgi:hypothetical protein
MSCITTKEKETKMWEICVIVLFAIEFYFTKCWTDVKKNTMKEKTSTLIKTWRMMRS